MSDTNVITASVEVKPIAIEGEYNDVTNRAISTSSAIYLRIGHKVTIKELAKSLRYLEVFGRELTDSPRNKIMDNLLIRYQSNGFSWFSALKIDCPTYKAKLDDKEGMRLALIQCLTLFPEIDALEY